MEVELNATIAAYENLLDQCQGLARSTGYILELILAKVMPKAAADRTDTARIREWFDGVKHEVVERKLEQEAERAQISARDELITTLKLTPEQLAILGVDTTPTMKV